tara:strand:- start:90 stop:383 length:294 start_codon:yes stop_codon:yes gene_type:complete
MSDVTVGLRRHILQDLADWKENSTAEGNTWTFWKLGFFWKEVSIEVNDEACPLLDCIAIDREGILGPLGRLEVAGYCKMHLLSEAGGHLPLYHGKVC